MKLLSLLIPQAIYKTTSQFSGEIKVIDHVFERRLVVGGLTQSGGIMKGIWRKALDQKHVTRNTKHVNSILILGLGAGTVVEIINQKWPDAKIIGVEIDPEIINIGKKYFQLNDIKNLKIVIGDAFEIINQKSLTIHQKFDLIIVDLYHGKHIEKNIENVQFLQKVALILVKNGIVIFNVVAAQTNDFEASVFLDKLSRIYKDNFCKRIITNDFFFCTTPRFTGQAITKGGDTVHGKEKKKEKKINWF